MRPQGDDRIHKKIISPGIWRFREKPDIGTCASPFVTAGYIPYTACCARVAVIPMIRKP
jgi:hypothetical protein